MSLLARKGRWPPSCSPTCWFVDGGDDYEGLMVATRDLGPGDELTYDYCTSEDCDLTPAWDCHCGAAFRK